MFIGLRTAARPPGVERSIAARKYVECMALIFPDPWESTHSLTLVTVQIALQSYPPPTVMTMMTRPYERVITSRIHMVCWIRAQVIISLPFTHKLKVLGRQQIKLMLSSLMVKQCRQQKNAILTGRHYPKAHGMDISFLHSKIMRSYPLLNYAVRVVRCYSNMIVAL